jgi:hypothetical protein
MSVIGLDTGPKHCGIVLLDNKGLFISGGEVSPETMYEFLETLPEDKESIIAVEKFQLYPKGGQFKVWSRIPEAEIIGVVNYIAGRKHRRVIEVSASAHKAHKKNYDYERLRISNPHVQDAYSIAMWVVQFKLKG